MSAVILYVFATLFVGGLGLIAQQARKSRGAEVTLLVVLLALSLLVALLGAATSIGLFFVAANRAGGVPEQLLIGSAGVAALLVGVIGLGLCVPPLRKVFSRGAVDSWWADPPVFLALWLFTVVLANNVVSLLVFTQVPDVSALFPSGRISLGAILTSQLPFLVVALLGVGIFTRRSIGRTLARLGYGPITPKQLGVVALFIPVAIALSFGADSLFSALQPNLYETVGTLSNDLFNPQGMSPVSVILFALLIGVGAGLGEETLFRGAVQPVLGITLTSILFASMHVQYGPSLLIGYIFVLAVGLGLLRRYINTTASFLAHAGYNSLMVILAYFLGA
ncbi:MAG: CPBP family intramembrane glutamic endopeptidase [Rubrobacteraceae bacterium]